MTNEKITQWYKDEEKSFQGWDFSYLKGRWKEEKLPWSYDKIVRSYLKPEHKILDMGTGGGEYLLSLNHPYENTFVTESWEPNVKLCREKLEPLGITVKETNDCDDFPVTSKLPFEDDFFDLVINRHESYNPLEVNRVLKDKGLFITQQVGGKNNNALSECLIENFVVPYPKITLQNFVKDLGEKKFDILRQEEAYPKLEFYDVGAFVYFAKVIEWEFPGFSVDRCKDKLLEIAKQIEQHGLYESREHRFLIVAKNCK
jgi:SAM-dependent methyltransferase